MASYSETQKRISLNADSSVAVFTGVPGQPGAASPNSGNQFRFVKVTGVHLAGLTTGATHELAMGVVANKPQYVNNAAEIVISGVVPVQVGTGGVTAGQAVKTDSAGQAITATVGTDVVLGIALDTAAAGSLVPVLLQIA